MSKSAETRAAIISAGVRRYYAGHPEARAEKVTAAAGPKPLRTITCQRCRRQVETRARNIKYCPSCRSAQDGRQRWREQQRSYRERKRSGLVPAPPRRWTTVEDQYILDHADEWDTNVAATLDRTAAAVRTRRAYLLGKRQRY